MVDIDWFIALIYQVLSHFFRACIENNMNWFTKINIYDVVCLTVDYNDKR